MSDVRDELLRCLQDKGWISAATIAALILERFDVTAKPVVTAEELGRMVHMAVRNSCLHEENGRKLLDQLEAAGLVIVRRDEVQR